MALTPTIATTGAITKRDRKIYSCLQTNYGAVNASPVFEPFRRISGGVTQSISYVKDETVVDGFQGQDNVKDETTYAVSLEASTSKQSIRLMQEAMYSQETIFTATASTFAAVATGFTVPAGTYSALSVGDGFWVTGFAGATINGFYIVSSKTGGNTIVTSIAPAATEAAGASVTIKSTKYLNANNQFNRTFQERLTDLSKAGNTDFATFFDGFANAFSMSIAEQGIVANSIEYVIERKVDGTAAIAGQTDAAATTDRSVSAVDGVKGFYVNDLSATCKMKSLDISIALNQQADNAAACSKRYTRGTPEFGGSSSIRLLRDASTTWRDYNTNGTRISIAVRMSHSATEETYIVFPQVVITEATLDEGEVTTISATFAAELHASKGYTGAIFTNW